MADQFQIVPYKVRSAGTDVPPEEVQAAINSLASQTQAALNVLATGPTGAAGGDLSGTYPNPTVVNLHVTGGTESGVAVTGNTINSSAIGQTTPAAGAFTTLTATTPVAITSGGTGSGTAGGARTNLGLGTIATQNANNVAVAGGTIDNTPIGQTTTAAGSFTTLNSTGGALNGTVGGTTPNTGSFTTLAASGAVSGTGFTNLFASPPPIGSTAANTGAFTTLNASGNDALLYQNSSAQSIPNNAQTTVTAWTKIYDRVNANFNAATGTFTAPANGFYQVSGQLSFSSAAGVVGANYASAINVNGTIVTEGAFFQESTSTTSVSAPFSAVVQLTAGQTIVIQAFQNTGVARTLLATATFTYVSINRIP